MMIISKHEEKRKHISMVLLRNSPGATTTVLFHLTCQFQLKIESNFNFYIATVKFRALIEI